MSASSPGAAAGVSIQAAAGGSAISESGGVDLGGVGGKADCLAARDLGVDPNGMPNALSNAAVDEGAIQSPLVA